MAIMMTKSLPIALLMVVSPVLSFNVLSGTTAHRSKSALFSISEADSSISRRNAFMKSATVIAGGLGIISSSPFAALAEDSDEAPVVTNKVSEETPVVTNTISEETPVVTPVATSTISDETPIITTRMGGLLEKYQDSRGWKILAPSGWNKFEGEVGAYDVKWQDVVDPSENIKVSSNPVKSTTSSIIVLGEVKAVGKNLASKRSAKLVKAEERLTDGILFYTFDFALEDKTHQLLLLCVNKGRIWSLDANSTQKRWAKRESLYNNVLGSFMPKLS